MDTSTQPRTRQAPTRLAPIDVRSVARLGTTVCVWAHPDDESYLAGGLMAALRLAGQRVVCVTATLGEVGDGSPATDRAALGRLRGRELSAALTALGVVEHLQLGYADGGCAQVDPGAAEAAVGGVLRRVRPDTVVSFGPDGVTGHPDHQAVAAWTRAAVDACHAGERPRLLQCVTTQALLDMGRDVDEAFGVYALGGPRVCTPAEIAVRLDLPAALLDRKLAALRAHRSQTQALIDHLGVQRYSSWVAVEAFAAPAGTSGTDSAVAQHWR